ncbi:MAG: hypothetical protein Q4C85_03310 [Actinomyces sp.]|nr:hypothetical protein [Actinomyces sp.]MDO4242778.1 hypothetical protein [Actinomyces sp.]
MIVAAAAFSFLAVTGYTAWLRIEAARAQRTAWAEVTDPVD